MKRVLTLFEYKFYFLFLILSIFLIIAGLVSCNSNSLGGLKDGNSYNSGGTGGGGTMPPPPPPAFNVTNGYASSSTTVTVVFSTDADFASASNVLNYSIVGLTISAAVRDALNYNTVKLTTTQQGTGNYTVVVSNVTDTYGNTLDTVNSYSFTGDAPPYIVSATPVNNTTVTVQFSEAVEITSAETIGNYFIGGITVTTAIRSAVDFSKVTLTTSSQSNTGYTVSVSNVKDATGNTVVSPNTASFTGYTTPYVVSASAPTNTTVVIIFSENVQLSGAQTLGNYGIVGLTVSSAVRDAVDNSKVTLNTSAQSALNYTVIVSSNVKNMAGISIGSPNNVGFNGYAWPYVVSATATGNSTVVVTFSENVQQAGAETTTNYGISSLFILSAARDAVDYSKVTLTTTGQSAAAYTVSVSGNVKNMSGISVGTPYTANFNGYLSPYIVSATTINNTTVQISFSENVDQAEAETTTNYSINNGLNVISAVRDAVTYSLVTLTTSSQSNIAYTVTVSSNVTSAAPYLTPLGTPNTAGFTGDALPFVTGAAAVSTTSVQVSFSENVDITTSQTSTNYSIAGLTISAAVRDAGDYSKVLLTTSVQADQNYTVSVSGVKDTTGNLMGTPSSYIFAGAVAPYIKSVASYGNTSVVVYFSKSVDPTTAQTTTNYSTSPVLAISAATRDASDYTKVVLTTASQTSGTGYTLTINNVKDLTGLTIASPSTAYFTGTGVTDTIPPYVLSAVRLDTSTVQIAFSEPVNTGSQTTTNYTILDSYNNTVSITGAVRQTDTSKVNLAITATFTDFVYTVIVGTGVKDIAGNSMAASPKNTASFSGTGTVPQTFADGPVVVDPMNEGANAFGLLLTYKGRIYLGPSTNDNAMLSLKPDGTDAQVVTFYFHGTSTTTTSLNPGPDSEDGIDYFTSGTINGTEYMFIGPSRSTGSLSYIYYTTDAGSTINFHYINYTLLGGQTKGTSSMTVFNNSLYSGFPDTGGARPYFIKLMNVVQSPATGTDILNLQGKNFPRMGASGTNSNGASIVGIDVFGIYNDRLYLANGGSSSTNNDGGIVKSTTNDPSDYVGFPGDWQDITPTGISTWYNTPTNNRYSIALASTNKLAPADRAFPAMAVFNGNLYAIRNTGSFGGGPQIWKYNGTSWTLIAGGSNDISEMGNSNNTDITMLVTNGDRLYVGYNNSNDGVSIYRTKNGITDPSVVADFELVSSGLGDANNNRTIYSALSANSGGIDYLWILCGKNWLNQRVYRTMN